MITGKLTSDAIDQAVIRELLAAKARNPAPVYRIIRDAVALHRALNAEPVYRKLAAARAGGEI